MFKKYYNIPITIFMLHFFFYIFKIFVVISDGDGGSCRIHGTAQSLMSDEISVTEMTTDCSKSSILLRSPGFLHSSCPPAMHKSCFCIRFIAEHTKITDDATKVTIFVYLLIEFSMSFGKIFFIDFIRSILT